MDNIRLELHSFFCSPQNLKFSNQQVLMLQDRLVMRWIIMREWSPIPQLSRKTGYYIFGVADQMNWENNMDILIKGLQTSDDSMSKQV